MARAGDDPVLVIVEEEPAGILRRDPRTEAVLELSGDDPADVERLRAALGWPFPEAIRSYRYRCVCITVESAAAIDRTVMLLEQAAPSFVRTHGVWTCPPPFDPDAMRRIA